MTTEGAAAHAFKDLGGAIYAWRGFFMSVRMATSRVLLNVQPKSAALYEHEPLNYVYARFKKENGPKLIKLHKFLSKVKVVVTHLPVKKNKANQVIPRVKTISGVSVMLASLFLLHC